MPLLWIKAVHVISIISWMAGLLYLYRLFVYHAMSTEPAVHQQLQVMERKLINGIAHPAGVLSVATGIAMLTMIPSYLSQPWMHVKLACVLGLLVSHGMGMRYRKKLITQPNEVPHRTFRLLNEVPTVLMIVIVVMIIVRPWSQ